MTTFANLTALSQEYHVLSHYSSYPFSYLFSLLLSVSSITLHHCIPSSAIQYEAIINRKTKPDQRSSSPRQIDKGGREGARRVAWICRKSQQGGQGEHSDGENGQTAKSL